MIVSSQNQSIFDRLVDSFGAKREPRNGFCLAAFLRRAMTHDNVTEIEEDTMCVMIGSCCRFCNSTTPFSRGEDSSQSCVDCGAVNEEHELVSLSHMKACAATDDPTTTGDNYSNISADGVESAAQTVERHRLNAKVSSLPVHTKRRLKIGRAEAEVKRQAIQDHRKSVKINQASDRFNRAVQLAIHKFFDGVSAHDSIQSHIRKSAFEIIIRNQTHAEFCDPATCDLHVCDVPAAVFSAVLVRVTCENMISSSSAFPDVGKLDILRILDSANATVRHQEGGVVISKATQAIRLTLATSDCSIPCTGVNTTTTSFTKTDSAESLSSKPVFAIRDAIWAEYNLCKLSPALRDHTLRCLGTGRLETWISCTTFSSDVTAAVLLVACAALRKEKSLQQSPALSSDVEKTSRQLDATCSASRVSRSLLTAMTTEVREYIDVSTLEDDDEL